MPKTGNGQPPWRRLTGLGFEFFGAVFGFVLLGVWIDRRYDTAPRGVLICAALGIVGGLYHLVRAALATLDSAEQKNKDRKSRDDIER